MEELQKKIDYNFKNENLLRTALTHSSYANEKHDENCRCYERLEFLGDSVLELVTAEFLYNYKPSLPEGSMTRLRAELVCEGSLHKTALSLNLGKYMLLGKGEEKSGGRERPSILADMVEAIIAAIYIDSGYEQAKRFIIDNILSKAEISANHRTGDFKTELQELVQKKHDQRISYELISETGPDHNKIFSFRVSINGIPAGEGSGRTKKEAEQMAAMKALEDLKK